MNAASIKICGVTRPRDARLALEAGADFVGVVLAPGPRQVERPRVERIAREVPPERLVAVFDAPPSQEVLTGLAALGVGGVQVHGDADDAALARRLRRAGLLLWRAVEAGPGFSERIERAARIADRIVADLPKRNGTAPEEAVRDRLWRDAADAVRRGVALYLAGRLGPEDVRRALAEVRPAGVDVCRGVERRPGVKDEILVRRFVREARR